MSNIQPALYSRLWAHCILAILVITWTCYIIVVELRNFVRVRQSYLTSPQHRLRASAATVLVQALPRKYINREKLSDLFDVFPGGIRNIWVNRDYDKLSQLIDERNDLAKTLEEAETDLVRSCWNAHLKNSKSASKGNAPAVVSQTDGPGDSIDPAALRGDGISANNPGQVHHNVIEAVDAINKSDADEEDELNEKGNLLGRGIDKVAQGFHKLGRGVGDGLGTIIGRGNNANGQEGNDGAKSGVFRTLTHRRRKKAPSGGHVDAEPATEQNEVLEPSDSQRTSDNMNPTTDESSPRESDQLEKEKKRLPYDTYYDEDGNLEPKWAKFIKKKDRPSMRASIKWKWCPSWMNPVATRVDTIWYCRREIAKLNKLIEEHQKVEAEDKYPKMRSAFIQFNNQAAAHMACQSVAHHTPSFMVPRLVEIAPNDVLWENMSISGWQRYVRTGIVFVICTSLVVLWTPLIAASSAISQLDALRKTPGFTWLQSFPNWLISLIQGILPVVLVSTLIWLLGVLLRFIIKYQGAPTRMQVELSVQKYFFGFAFIQYFLIVTIASAVSLLLNTIRVAITKGELSFFIVPRLLAQNIPQASNYFLSNILLQSLSQSAGGLAQPGALWLLFWAVTTNSMARDKFRSRTKLQKMRWGTKYPLYSVLACVAIIYSVISPLILPLSMIGFGIWWISTRYQMLYIYKYTTDTGGLLFPVAMKQLFVGLFTLEFFLIGYFILVSTGSHNQGAPTEAIIPMTVVMVLCFVGTMIFYVIVKNSFDPLLKYLPITLEDEAVRRDEEFEKLLRERHSTADEGEMMRGASEGLLSDHENDDEDSNSERQAKPGTADLESQPVRPGLLPRRGTTMSSRQSSTAALERDDGRHLGVNNTWAERKRRSAAWGSRSPSRHKSNRSSAVMSEEELNRRVQDLSSTAPVPRLPRFPSHRSEVESGAQGERAIDEGKDETGADRDKGRSDGAEHSKFGGLPQTIARPLAAPIGFVRPDQKTVEQRNEALAAEAKKLYGNIPDDLEDLTPAERDILLSRAFRHEALRSKRPCIWIPRDGLGVSDDEVRNTEKFTKWIWISNEKQVLTAKGKCEYKGPPPDFDEVDLIQL